MWSRLFFFFFSFSYIRKNNKRATHNTPLNKRGCPPLFLSRKSLFPSITRRPGISSFSRTRKTYNTYTRQQMNFSPTTTIKNRRYMPLTHSRENIQTMNGSSSLYLVNDIPSNAASFAFTQEETHT
jgi:hypothetical protein